MKTSQIFFTSKGRCLALLLLSYSMHSNAENVSQTDKFQFNLFTEMLMEGELDIEEDALIGGELKYFFDQNQTFKHFVAGGYRTDLENEGSSVDIFNIDIGSQYSFGKLWGNRAFVEYSVGAIYSQVDYSIDLIDRETSHSFDEFNYKASVAVGLDFQEDFSTQLFINRLGDSTTLGLGVSYRF